MEGSAISRSVNGPMKINQSRDPDMDGTWKEHPASSKVIMNSDKASPSGLGRDKFVDSDPTNEVEIRGGAAEIPDRDSDD